MPETAQPLMSNKVYDFLKRLIQVILPAFGALYFSLAGIWGLPAPEQVVGTITIVITFLGVTLNISTKRYDAALVVGADDGRMLVSETPDGSVFTLELDATPEQLEAKDHISFKVVKY